ncbi:[Fe-Fe] hydrogenase large subunit C-terminal domain-containing protein [candidate division KSB1 bacterium]
MKYYHVHKVDPDKCSGRMICMRNCPTQAIRIRDGKAVISEELCVDCGMCISLCPTGGLIKDESIVADISQYKYKVVVPSAVLYTQFEAGTHPYIIHQALKKLGFDEVVDLKESVLALSKALVQFLKKYKGRLPLISSHCPSIVRLIQVKYPDLVELIVPLDVPREVTAREIRKNLQNKLGLKPHEIGIIYISPCPSKIVSIKQPAEKEKSWFDGAISIQDIFPLLIHHVISFKEDFDPKHVSEDFVFHSGWTTFGSVTVASQMENWLAVSGLPNVMRIFDDIENSRLRNVDFVEALACMLGCVSGKFCMENPYVARANMIKQREKYEKPHIITDNEINIKLKNGYYFFKEKLLPRPLKYFDTDLETSIKRMREKERVFNKLPQIDCGICGSPTCMTFAEDFVRGEVDLTDCIIIKQKVGPE